MIYFVISPDADLIKIGYTNSPIDRRFKSLQYMSPVPFVLLGTTDGDLEYERDLHKKFAHLRRHGEWFKASGDLVGFISEIQARKRKEDSLPITEPSDVKPSSGRRESPQPIKFTSWENLPLTLTTNNVADFLGVHPNTIKRLVRSKELPCFRVGQAIRINKADLMRYTGYSTKFQVQVSESQ